MFCLLRIYCLDGILEQCKIHLKNNIAIWSVFQEKSLLPLLHLFVFDLIVSINIYKIWQVSKTGENQNHSLNASKY